MNSDATQAGVLGGHLPGALVFLLAIVFLAAWPLLYRYAPRIRNRHVRNWLPLGRWVAASLALWFALEALSLLVILATRWPLFVIGAIGATAIEGVIALYRLERGVVNRKTGRYIAAMRIAAIVLLTLILAEPILEHVFARRFERHVVVLLDESESMLFDDPQRDGKELLDLGAFYGVVRRRDYTELSREENPVVHLSYGRQEEIEKLQAEGLTRREFAQKILHGGEGRSRGLLEELARRYEVRVVRFAATARTPGAGEGEDGEVLDAGDIDWARLTNLTAALEFPLENVPPEQLAGVVMISDFRDTARSAPEVVAAQYGRRGAPVYPLLLGSRRARRDLAIVHVDSPENIYEGERVRAVVEVKLDGIPGQAAFVKFSYDGALVEEQTVMVPEDRDEYRTVVEFTHQPETEGIHPYTIEIETAEPVEGEAVLDNRRWDFQTAVTEDRTNVLLVDTRPRWEFRYLRNLLYGRDESVHLQYVMVAPDFIDYPEGEAPLRAPITASASRPFGEAEADRLPDDPEEWRKFDVIIMGDVSPDVLTEDVLEHIQYCVSERGAAFFVIAGPNFMPHKFDSPILNELLPVLYSPTDRPYFIGPDTEYRLQLALTREGRTNPIMRLAAGASVSEALWGNLPDLQWRYQTEGVKPGATVLAYAATPETMGREVLTSATTAEETAQRIREMNEMQERNSLIVVQQYGLGRVMMLNFDRTWRLRHRVGDALHHRFWGQTLNWGAGETLRAGSEFVRLGTERLTYNPDERIRVTSRVLHSDYSPVVGDESVTVTVYRDDVPIATPNMQYRMGSQGMYDTEIGPFEEPGRYRITLSGPAVERILEEEQAEPVSTEFMVARAKNPVELAELTADESMAERIAYASGGSVVTLGNVELLHEAFGAGTIESDPERADLTLWDNWLMLLVLIGLFTSEWLLRRKGGLP